MASGSYDRTITISQLTESVAANGDRTDSFSDLITLKCRVEPTGGGENWSEEQRVASNIKNFYCRYLKSFSIKESMQLLFEGDVYNITNVYENTKAGRRVELMITAVQKDNN